MNEFSNDQMDVAIDEEPVVQEVPVQEEPVQEEPVPVQEVPFQQEPAQDGAAIEFIPSRKPKPKTRVEIYSAAVVHDTIVLPITVIGKDLPKVLTDAIKAKVEGKCIVQGFVEPGSVSIVSFSSGVIVSSNVRFDVVFSCQVCFPVPGLRVWCVAKNVTKAGIRAESSNKTPSPFVLFVARDHFSRDEIFQSVKPGDTFEAEVLAQRFELNDKYVSIMGKVLRKGRNTSRNAYRAVS